MITLSVLLAQCLFCLFVVCFFSKLMTDLNFPQGCCNIPSVFKEIMTDHETWIFHYDSETKVMSLMDKSSISETENNLNVKFGYTKP
jgi:hypothetical protein